MKKELEEKLIKDFPKLFQNVNAPITHSLMAFGCEHADGWFDLLYSACKEIQKQCDKEGIQVKFSQIKEKFGTLCLYIVSGTDKIFNIIDKYEELSKNVCEICGSTENVKLRGKHWYKSLCEDCNKDWQK